MARIYISSTYEDLKSHRAEVDKTLRQLGHQVVCMENYVASEQRPADKCLADVSECDLYVGIFAFRYGFIPPSDNPNGWSITEMEYRRARELRRACLVFLMHKDAPWPLSATDAYSDRGDRGARIEALREDLEKLQVVNYFRSADELAKEVSVAVQDHVARHQRIEEGLQREREANAQASALRSGGQRARVFGTHLLDVADAFVGRSAELDQLGKLLALPTTNIVTVIGRAGIGKTALASKLLGDLEDNRWPHTAEAIPVDGIVYLSTRSSGISLERLFLGCARMMGGDREASLAKVWGSTAPVESKVTSLLDALRDGLYVILLDHLEDLLDDEGRLTDEELAIFLTRSLSTPHDARLLVTSRIPLAFPPDVMHFDQRVALEQGLGTKDGIAFLRALDATGTLNLRDAPEPALAAAVERVHGVPRALQAIAGLLEDNPLATLDEILADVYRHDDVVSGLVAKTYQRLDEAARHFLESLAIFGRPVPLHAVEFMTSTSAATDVKSLVSRLARLQLIRVHRAEKKLSMHPIDQDYFCSRIDAEARTVLELRAAEYYAKLRAPQKDWNGLLDVEPHLLEFEHRMAARDHEGAMQVLALVDGFLTWRGHPQRALEMHAAVHGKLQSPPMQLLDHFGTGEAHVVIGPLDRAIREMTTALELARSLGDVETERRALGARGDAFRRLGRAVEAVADLKQAVDLFQEGTMPVHASHFFLLSLALVYGGSNADAIEVAERLEALARKEGDADFEARAHDAMSLAHLNARRFERALHHAQRALELFGTIGVRDPVGYVLNLQGMALLGLNRTTDAIAAFERGRTLGRDDENRRIEGFCSYNLARAQSVEAPAVAAAAADEAAQVFAGLGSPEEVPARWLAEALRTGDEKTRAQALVACARTSLELVDLYSPLDLLAEAESLAIRNGLEDLRREATALRERLESYVDESRERAEPVIAPRTAGT